MTASSTSAASHHGAAKGSHMFPDDDSEEDNGRWYFSRREIEENSPSRRDGIDLKKETYLRKSYCTFLQDLGMRLKVPQVTIATAIIFCHRFFLRQSLAKNDRRTIATVCMFLAGKVEETPRPLKDVILVSYEMIHKKNPPAAQKIKQKEVYEQQKELILLGEKVVLTTLGFDFNVLHPYKPLVDAIKKFKVAQNALAQVAWNFVNDGLRTALSLQFEPHHIAAGAIFLAAKFLKVRLPSDGEQAWWQEFDVTPHQLQEVSNQMMELYEQSTLPSSNASEAEGSVCGPKAGERGASRKTTASSKQELSKLETDPPHSNNHSQNYNPHNPEISSDEINNIQHLKRKSEHNEHDHEGNSGKTEVGPGENSHGGNLQETDGTKKLDKEKIKAALERKKARGDTTCNKLDAVDELERELEDVELPSESEKIKCESKQSGSECLITKSRYSNQDEFDMVVEEGEVESFDDDAETKYHQSPEPSSSKRKTSESPEEGKLHVDVSHLSHKQNEHGCPEDRNRNSERDNRRHMHENWA